MFDISALSITEEQQYAAFFCTLGFEQRARFVAEAVRPNSAVCFALGFDSRKVLSYDRNLAFFKEAQYQIVDIAESEQRAWLAGVADEVDGSTLNGRRILVDVSSMSRARMALFVEELCLRSWAAPTTIDFIYAPAMFSDPPGESEVPNTHVGPVSPRFAGWSPDPDLVPDVIMGLGYEHDRALGAVEHIQPGRVWAFLPHSSEIKYEAALIEANEVLLELIPESHQLPYSVMQPLDCLGRVMSLVRAAGRDANPILIPFGPKIFSVCALLVGASNSRCSVWRVSADGGEEATERTALGVTCGLSVRVGM